MPVFNPTANNSGVIAGNVQQKLQVLRNALESCNDLFRWSSALSSADLEAVGFSATDAQSLLTAVADANALYVLFNTGLPPSTYPQPPSAYIYATSQAVVTGPQ